MQTKHVKQANFLIPDDLLTELRKFIPRGEQSHFVAQALHHEMKRLRFQLTLEKSFGAWRPQHHAELKKGSTAFIRSLRRSSRLRNAP